MAAKQKGGKTTRAVQKTRIVMRQLAERLNTSSEGSVRLLKIILKLRAKFVVGTMGISAKRAIDVLHCHGITVGSIAC